MNARKPIEAGCLAIVTRTSRCPENLHRLVRVVHRVWPGFSLGDGSGAVYVAPPPGEPQGPFWLIQPVDSARPLMVAFSDGTRHPDAKGTGIAQRCLMRIDNPDGDDETMEWAGKPPTEAAVFDAKMRRAFADLRKKQSSR